MFNSIFSSTFYTYILVNLAFALAVSICVSIAINIDAKANNIQHKNLWVSFGFFANLFAGFIYLISRAKLISNAPYYCSNCNRKVPNGATVCPECNSNELVKINNHTKKTKTICIILIILAVVLAISSRAINDSFNLDEEFPEDDTSSLFGDIDDTFEHKAYNPTNTDEFEYYYDMNKKPYIDTLEVPYYTENGDEYIYEFCDDGEGLINNNTGEFHKSEECFVNKNGYLFFDNSLYDEINDYDYSVEKDNEIYYLAAYVSWDDNGNLVDKYGFLINEELH